jgi:putative transposase
MARLPRLIVPNQPHHVIQRGTDGTLIFRDDADYRIFLRHLRDASKAYSVAIHAYVLMSNHVHLLASPSDVEGLAKMMQWIGRQYVPYFNRRYQRTGTLWQGRYRTSVIDTEHYFMVCSRYIELNPVRAALCVRPEDHLWSSYRHHIGLQHDSLITEHGLYWSLGNTPFEREAAYRGLVEQGLHEREIVELQDVMNRGWALGTTVFKENLEKQTNRRVAPGKRGRPKKTEPNQ